MRYFEIKDVAPEKVISEEKYSDTKFFLLKLFSVFLWVGFGVMFFAYVYRKQWANFREIQKYGALFGSIGVIGFCIVCRTLGISVRRMTWEKYRSIMKNQVSKPYDDGLAIRKHLHNTLYTLPNSWTLFPGVYTSNPNKQIPIVITGPGGVFGVNFVFGDPRKKDFVDPAKPLAEGKVALDDKLGTDMGMVIIFRRNKKHYNLKNEKIHLFSFPELFTYLNTRPQVLSEAELEKINKTVADLSGADMSKPID